MSRDILHWSCIYAIFTCVSGLASRSSYLLLWRSSSPTITLLSPAPAPRHLALQYGHQPPADIAMHNCTTTLAT